MGGFSSFLLSTRLFVVTARHLPVVVSISTCRSKSRGEEKEKTDNLLMSAFIVQLTTTKKKHLKNRSSSPRTLSLIDRESELTAQSLSLDPGHRSCSCCAPLKKSWS